MTSSGCGALLGALWLAQRRSVIGLGRIISLASGLFGVGLITFSLVHVLWLAIPCLVAGWLSSRIGAGQTLFVGGTCCIAGALWFGSALPAIRVAVRPIYVRLGILPEMASGLEHAAEVSVPPEQS
jgi:hypothetical protein